MLVLSLNKVHVLMLPLCAENTGKEWPRRANAVTDLLKQCTTAVQSCLQHRLLLWNLHM